MKGGWQETSPEGPADAQKGRQEPTAKSLGQGKELGVHSKKRESFGKVINWDVM